MRSIFRTQLYAQLGTVLTAVTLFAVAFLWWQTASIRRSLNTSLQQTAGTVALNVDRELQQMDSLSINIIYSNLIKESVGDYIDLAEAPGLTADSARQRNTNAEMLTNMLFAIMGADRPVKQINLYNLTGGCFGTGIANGYVAQSAADQPWYARAATLGGLRCVTAPAENTVLARHRGGTPTVYISIVRQYFDMYNLPQGYVEIIQDADTVFSTAAVPESAYTPRVLIYNTEGEVVFPYAGQAGYTGYLQHRAEGVAELHNPDTGGRELVAFAGMEHTGFVVAVVLDSAQYYTPLWTFLLAALLILLAVTGVLFAVSYTTNRRISAPLTEMYQTLSAARTNEELWQQRLPPTNTGIFEIDVLRDSIDHFQQQLKQSTENIMLLQRQDLQSQMLALQSQMNPHFLYNSLSTISAMAEEGLNEEIGEMCRNVTTILRYISSNKRSYVLLEEELETCSIYLASLKLRFGGQLSYDFNIPDEMLGMLVPKLTVQLLVENAIKYTTVTQPPWHIGVKGETDGNIWSIQVADNGVGFSDEALEEVLGRMEEVSRTGALPSLELSGMGLMNIYVRLHLLYGNGFIFKFANRRPRGAVISIGGKVLYEDSVL